MPSRCDAFDCFLSYQLVERMELHDMTRHVFTLRRMRVRHFMRRCYMRSLQSALQRRAPDLLYIKRRVDRITTASTLLMCMATRILNNNSVFFQTKLSLKAFCANGQSQKPSFLYPHYVFDNQVLTCASLARRYALWTLNLFLSCAGVMKCSFRVDCCH